MKSSISRLRKELERQLFKLKVFHLKSEQSIPACLYEVYMIMHFVLLIEAVCYRIRFFSVFYLYLEASNLIILWMSSGLTIVYLLMIVGSLVISHQITIHQKLPSFVDLTAKVGPVFERVVFPFLLWSYFTAVNHGQNLPIASSVAAPAILIGVVLEVSYNMWLRNTMPTNAFNGTLDLRYCLFNFVTNSVVVVLGVLAKNVSGTREKVLMYSTIAILAITKVGISTLMPIFWDSRANRACISFNMGLLVISLWNILLVLFDSVKTNWAVVFLVIGFVPKLSSYICQKQDQINIFAKTTPTMAKLRGLSLLTGLMHKSWLGELEAGEELQLQTFRLQMIERAKRQGRPEEEAESAIKRCSALTQFLAEAAEEYPKSVNMAKFELLARLMAPSDNILKAFLSLKKYKRLLGHGLLSRFESQFFEMLFEARLEAFYCLRPEEKTSQETVIKDLFNNYIINAGQNINTKVADICQPLKHKMTFLRMTDLIKTSIGHRIDIFKYIWSKSNSSAHLLSVDLYRFNRRAMFSLDKSLEFIQKDVKDLRWPPSYYYPPQFVLQALVQHNTLEARKTMRSFKKSLQHWDIIRVREQSLRLDVLDVHSAVLQVSLQLHDRGRIVDVTPNWPEMLGEINDGGSIINHNVNDLFIDLLAKKHAVMMNNSFGLTRLLNIKRDFYIKTFTGELKAVIFTLRLWPSLEKDLTGVVAIGPSTTQRQGQNMVLLQPNMDIIQAEEGFWTNIGKDNTGKEMTNILQITTKLQIVNRLLDILESFLADSDSFRIESEIDTPLEAIYRISKVIIKLNNNCSLVYRVDRSTSFYKNLIGTPLMCRLNIVRFMDVTISQLFIRFGIKDLANQIAMSNNKLDTLTNHLSIDSCVNLKMMKTVQKKLQSIDDMDQVGDKDHFAANSMTLGEKLKVWNEEERPTDVDLVLAELFKWVGHASEDDVRLCPIILKQHLVKFGEVIASWNSIGGITPFVSKRHDVKAFSLMNRMLKDQITTTNPSYEDEPKPGLLKESTSTIRVNTRKVIAQSEDLLLVVNLADHDDVIKDSSNQVLVRKSISRDSEGAVDLKIPEAADQNEADDGLQNFDRLDSQIEEIFEKPKILKSGKDYIIVGYMDDLNSELKKSLRLEQVEIDAKFNEMFVSKKNVPASGREITLEEPIIKTTNIRIKSVNPKVSYCYPDCRAKNYHESK